MQCMYRVKGHNCQFQKMPSLVPLDLRGTHCLIHAPLHEKKQWNEIELRKLSRCIDDLCQRAVDESKTLDLTGLSIPEGISQSPRTFPALLIGRGEIEDPNFFRGCTFLGSVNLQEIDFHERTSFQGSVFHGDFLISSLPAVRGAPSIDLSECTFAAGVRIELQVSELTLVRSRFLRDARLGPIVSDNYAMDGCEFEDSVHADLTVSKRFSASSTRFGKYSRWKLVRGEGDFSTIWDRASFIGEADFRGSVFSGRVSFAGASFHGNCRFSGVTFGGDAKFEEVTFKGRADFSGGADRGGKAVSFAQVRFSGSFEGAAIFVNREFSDDTDFGGAVFHVPPEFHGAQIHQSTRFPPEGSFRGVDDRNAAQAFRTLRLAMDALTARREIGMFFALEQRSLRLQPDLMTRQERVVSALYEWSSNYGRSFVRPLMGLLLSLFFFAAFYSALLGDKWSLAQPLDWARLGDLMTFSLQQMASPFTVWRDGGETHDLLGQEVSAPVLWFATFQSLLSLGLLSLGLLALRWRFKRD